MAKTSAQLPHILRRKRIEYIFNQIGQVQIKNIEKFPQIKKILKIFDKNQNNSEIILENLSYSQAVEMIKS
jgi:hypothetical protein